MDFNYGLYKTARQNRCLPSTITKTLEPKSIGRGDLSNKTLVEEMEVQYLCKHAFYLYRQVGIIIAGMLTNIRYSTLSAGDSF